MRATLSANALLLAAVAAACLAAGASAAPTPPLVLTASTPTPQVRCGEPLTLQIELRNTGASTVKFYLRGLSLDSGGQHLKPVPVPGRAEAVEEAGLEPWLPAKGAPKGARHTYVAIKPGEAALFEAVDPEASTTKLGQIKCTYRLFSEDPGLRQLLPLPAIADVQIEVLPSELMLTVWKAHTPRQIREALPAFLALLRHNPGAYARTSLTYMAGATLPLLDLALQERDPQDRVNALAAYGYVLWAIRNMDSIRSGYGLTGGPPLFTPNGPDLEAFWRRIEIARKAPSWARLLPAADAEEARRRLLIHAVQALDDGSDIVRAQAVYVLAQQKEASALEQVKGLAADPSPEVRRAVARYMQVFAQRTEAARPLAMATKDPDPSVRAAALRSLETSESLPAPQALAEAYAGLHGEEGLRIIGLLRQQEDERLPAMLEPGFAERTPQEQEAVLSALAGHSDEATLRLVRLGLSVPAPAVQRAALLRLLQFPAATAQPALDAARDALAPELAALAQDVRTELAERKIFPFLARPGSPLAVPTARQLPAHCGTLPLASPDGQWVAYLDTDGTRPGGTGGTGRSNLVTLVHVVRSDGTDDRVLSDMFLRGWMADSRRVASARDGFAAITDLDGNLVTEFGEPYEDRVTVPAQQPADWRDRNMRSQLGWGRMPHTRSLGPLRLSDMEYGEDAGFSPDGMWFGQLRTQQGLLCLAADGSRRLLPRGAPSLQGPSAWAPDAHRVAYVSRERHLTVLDFDDMSLKDLGPADFVPAGQWAGDPVWRPWDRQGQRLTFVRDGQVWVCGSDGRDARQLTFDTTPKRYPVFSPDGSRIVYLAYQMSKRQYTAAPTDVYVVDVATTLAVRITAPDGARTAGVDWLDRDKPIFDRQQGAIWRNFSSSLLVADLARLGAE